VGLAVLNDRHGLGRADAGQRLQLLEERGPFGGVVEPLDEASLRVRLAALRDKALKEKKPFDYDTEIEGLRALDRYTLQYKLEEPRPRFIDSLAASDLFGAVAREVVDEVRRAFRGGTAKRGSDAVGILKERLKQRLRGSDLSLAKVAAGPTVILVVGVNGSGKTTSVAKIAMDAE
jgi:signal recognition particle GTPase